MSNVTNIQNNDFPSLLPNSLLGGGGFMNKKISSEF